YFSDPMHHKAQSNPAYSHAKSRSVLLNKLFYRFCQILHNQTAQRGISFQRRGQYCPICIGHSQNREQKPAPFLRGLSSVHYFACLQLNSFPPPILEHKLILCLPSILSNIEGIKKEKNLPPAASQQQGAGGPIVFIPNTCATVTR